MQGVDRRSGGWWSAMMQWRGTASFHASSRFRSPASDGDHPNRRRVAVVFWRRPSRGPSRSHLCPAEVKHGAMIIARRRPTRVSTSNRERICIHVACVHQTYRSLWHMAHEFDRSCLAYRCTWCDGAMPLCARRLSYHGGRHLTGIRQYYR